MLDSFLRNVTKDSYGPIPFVLPNGTQAPTKAVVHKFHDTFSVLDWGKMPDVLNDLGSANAFVFHQLNTWVSNPSLWKDFLKSPDALTFRKAAASIPQSGNVSSMLNELGEQFPIVSQYLGLIDEKTFKDLNAVNALKPHEFPKFDFAKEAFDFKNHYYPVCEFIQEEKIPSASVMGRTVWDYSVWRNQSAPKILPFEFHCHFTLTEKTLHSLNTDCIAMPKTASIATLHVGSSWDFPLIELVLSQDPFKKRVSFSEALWITGFSPALLQKNMLTVAWMASFVRSQLHRAKLKLNTIELKLSMNSKGEFSMTDSFALEQLHLSHTVDGHEENLHLDSALDYYKKTSWFESVIHAQKQGKQQGLTEWKRLCVEPAAWLDAKVKEGLEKKSRSVVNALLGKPLCS